MKRGEIWTAAGGGDYAGKPRPVLIVQDDAFAETASVTVCLLTTHEVDASLVRIRIAPSANNGLREVSFAMADKITTVARSRLGEHLGALTPAAMAPVSRAIMVFLGLAGQARG
ncbi:MAG TPA: type II toxin-antitoxin system PemK/MazF family toxin [Allosphingosinicella sp.]|nr:type II toxin-antitoxin system PemK/MazF family toxin [Allosphingosinicella sp.]